MASIRPPSGGWSRRLWPGDEDLLVQHLLRLGPEDLRCRFMGSANEATVRAHVGRIRRDRRHVIGWFQQGTLRAAVEIAFEDGVAEAAVTTEAEFRRRGIARRLMERAVRVMATEGAERLVLLTSPSNAPMLALARAVGASLSRQGGEVVAELELSRPNALALYFDLLADRHGQFASALSDLNSMRDRAMEAWIDRPQPPG